MANGPHEHDWHYNEAEKIIWNGAMPTWEVVRFCPRCKEVEVIPLATNSNK